MTSSILIVNLLRFTDAGPDVAIKADKRFKPGPGPWGREDRVAVWVLSQPAARPQVGARPLRDGFPAPLSEAAARVVVEWLDWQLRG